MQATSTFPFHFLFHVLDASALENVIRKIQQTKEWLGILSPPPPPRPLSYTQSHLHNSQFKSGHIPPPIPVGFSDTLSPSNSQNIPNGNSSSTMLLFPTHQGQPTPLTSGNLPPPIPSIPTPINTVVPTQPKSKDNDNKSYDSKYWCCDRYNNNCNNVKAFHDPFIKRKFRRPPPKFIGSYSIEKSKEINGQSTTCQSDDIQSEQNNLRDDNDKSGCTVM